MNNPAAPDLDALFATVRAHPPETDGAEFAFETRFMARLRAERSASISAWAWRLCPYFALLAVGIVFWSRASTQWVEREAPLWAEASQAGEDQALYVYMTGDDPTAE